MKMCYYFLLSFMSADRYEFSLNFDVILLLASLSACLAVPGAKRVAGGAAAGETGGYYEE